jgi:hypothetical protein
MKLVVLIALLSEANHVLCAILSPGNKRLPITLEVLFTSICRTKHFDRSEGFDPEKAGTRIHLNDCN